MFKVQNFWTKKSEASNGLVFGVLKEKPWRLPPLLYEMDAGEAILLAISWFILINLWHYIGNSGRSYNRKKCFVFWEKPKNPVLLKIPILTTGSGRPPRTQDDIPMECDVYVSISLTKTWLRSAEICIFFLLIKSYFFIIQSVWFQENSSY